jgi:hypothetical protein
VDTGRRLRPGEHGPQGYGKQGVLVAMHCTFKNSFQSDSCE